MVFVLHILNYREELNKETRYHHIYLFIIAAEIVQYAYDLTLFVPNIECAELTLQLLDRSDLQFVQA